MQKTPAEQLREEKSHEQKSLNLLEKLQKKSVPEYTPKQEYSWLNNKAEKQENPRENGDTKVETRKDFISPVFRKTTEAKTTNLLQKAVNRDRSTEQKVNKILRNDKKEDDCLLFDGNKLTWYRNDKPLKSWKAMSGNKEYQDKKYTATKNVGPLPEGVWNVNQDKYQNYDDQEFWEKPFNYTRYIGFNKGQWSGGKPAWGHHRVWLEPDKDTDSQGRTDLSIHGGWTFGSAGCIDLADGMDDFAEMYRKYGKNMKLKVKYSPNFGK